MGTPEILPDSRVGHIYTRRNVVWRNGAWWVPIFCASCGNDGGIVPEENMTFAFYLCQGCADKYGHIDGIYLEPDVAFWNRVNEEQIDSYGRLLTQEELMKVVEDGTSPLAKLLKEKS